ncbi:MAG: insulinase family protein [Deltaproteobacteria bacterium]|nr:insulinase family protein [Deltaproteobacteria bacterium]
MTLCMALALAGCTIPQALGTRDEAQQEGMVRKTLGNGMKVVLVEDHASPVVALNVWVRTGSADEQPGEFGMAHVFEHMLFKGTERRAVGEIARTVESAGGNINAFTSFDMTVYHITMASRDADEGVDVLADAVWHSTFDPAELTKEMEVVVEEINRSEDSPNRVHSQALFALAYSSHPYGRPVIGTEESVRSFSREQMLDFHARWYVPNNMTFVAVGDFDSAAMMKQVEAVFGDATPRKDLAHPRTAEPVQTAARASAVRGPFQQTQLGIVWPITGFTDDDTAYLDLLAMVLGAGESSRLYQTVKDRERLVYQISASAYTPRDSGLFFVDAVLEPKQIEPALASIDAQVRRLAATAPSGAELERARVNLLAHEVHEKETMQGQARKYGYYETLGSGLEQEQEYLDRVRAASPEDVRRVAEKYLRPERANVAVLMPDAARPELDDAALLASLSSEPATAVTAKREELRDGIVRYRLPNGLRVVVKPANSIPLVSMRLSFLGGQLVESEADQGISAFFADMLDRGTEMRSASQFSAEIEGIAGSVEGFAGRNSFGLTGEFLGDSLDTGLDLFVDALLHPAFDPEQIEKRRADRLAAIERREDALAQKAFELFAREMYPNHPYRFLSIGTTETVSKLGADDFRAYAEKWMHPSNAVLGIVGDVDPDAIVADLAERLVDWTGPEKVVLPERDLPEPAAEPRLASLKKEKQQVHVVMGFLALTLADPDLPALDVLTQMLSGQGGRLFLELRDKRSLAYSVTAFSIEGLDPGSFGVYIASAPDKLDEARDGLTRELQRVLDGPIAEYELDRARNYLMGSNAVGLQRYATQASLLSLDELYGLEATHYLDYAERIAAVTLEDVERVARRLIRLDAPVVAVVE